MLDFLLRRRIDPPVILTEDTVSVGPALSAELRALDLTSMIELTDPNGSGRRYRITLIDHGRPAVETAGDQK